MAGDQVAVLGGHEIGLDEVGPLLDPELVGSERVLGPLAARAAVAITIGRSAPRAASVVAISRPAASRAGFVSFTGPSVSEGRLAHEALADALGVRPGRLWSTERSQMPRPISVVLAIQCLAAAAAVEAQPAAIPQFEPQAPRPRLALALSGGGARGVAHIGDEVDPAMPRY